METDLSEYHKGTDGLYYADYIAPNKAETFIGKHTGFYGPRYGNVNFKTVEKGTLWQCEIQMTRTRRCTWARARQIKK